MVRKGRNLDAVNELYADDVVSVEATAMSDGERVTEGKDGVRGKNQWWIENTVADGKVKREEFFYDVG